MGIQKAYTPFLPSEDENIKKMHDQGIGTVFIADAIGRTVGATASRISKLTAKGYLVNKRLRSGKHPVSFKGIPRSERHLWPKGTNNLTVVDGQTIRPESRYLTARSLGIEPVLGLGGITVARVSFTKEHA